MRTDAVPETEAWLRHVLLQVHAGEQPGEVIVRRETRAVIRLQSPRGPAVLKLWDLSDARSRMRRLLRRTKGAAERSALQRLSRSTVHVPELVGYLSLPDQELRYQEALWMQDLGAVVNLGRRFHSASKSRDVSEVRRLDQMVVEITKQMLEAQVYDGDHRIGNFVLDADDRVIRIDFENAWVDPPGPLRPRREGAMLGALLASYAWMSRYSPDFTDAFAKRLLDEIKPSLRTRRIAHRISRREMRRYVRRSGFAVKELEF